MPELRCASWSSSLDMALSVALIAVRSDYLLPSDEREIPGPALRDHHRDQRGAALAPLERGRQDVRPFCLGAMLSGPAVVSAALWVLTGRGPYRWLVRPFVNPFGAWL